MKYEEIRYLLFSKSYVAKTIVGWLRKQYKIKITKGKSNWDSILLKQHLQLIKKSIFYNGYETEKNRTERGLKILFAKNDVAKQITPEIKMIAKELNIDETLFRLFVLHNNIPKKISGRNMVFFASPYEPIKEMGYYIRVDENTTKAQLQETYDKLKLKLLALGVVRNQQKPKPKKLLRVKKRRDVAEGDPEKIKIFIDIEKEIEKVIKDKKTIDHYKLDYQRQTIGPAIERVAYNKSKEDSKKEKKLIKLYQGYYYDIIDRYNLPTYKDLATIHDLIFPKA